MDIKKDFPEQVSSLQNRKKINEGISEVEKEHNKIQSKKRIVIENTISRFKKYRILTLIYLETG